MVPKHYCYALNICTLQHSYVETQVLMGLCLEVELAGGLGHEGRDLMSRVSVLREETQRALS